MTSEPIRPFDVLAERAAGAMLLRRRSLGELKDLGQSASTARQPDRIPATTTLLGPLRSCPRPIHTALHVLDPFDAARLYPRAVRTDPGDVVFTERPRPTARVDDHGGALVASPTKVLRISSK